MPNEMTLGQLYWKELESEAKATRKCLERVPENLYQYKPHETSMVMKNLVLTCADIPRWIVAIVDKGEVNFATYEHVKADNPAEMAALFDKNMEMAKNSLEKATDESMKDMFYLKDGDKTLMSSPKGESVSSTINHLVHHRGQLTVYMRLKEIPVPSIYGPSADDKTF